MSIADRDKEEAAPLIKDLAAGGHTIYATEGTAQFIRGLGVPGVIEVSKLAEGAPNVVDIVEQGKVDAVVNTLSGGQQPMRDGFYIRRAAVERRIPCFTSLDTAITALGAAKGGDAYAVKPQSEYLNAPI